MTSIESFSTTILSTYLADLLKEDKKYRLFDNIMNLRISKTAQVYLVMGGCRAVLIKLGLEKEGATPLNWPRLLIAVFALFGSSFNITFLFPFLPQMVVDFGYQEEEKGYYVGLVASFFFVGRAFGSNLWGYLSDKKGRRPFLMICLILTAISTVIFGLSNSVAMAIGLRFMTGFVNGMVGIVKTILYELSDDSNQGIAMSTISLAWGSGIVIGPVVGGYLCLPATKYPSVFARDGFFAQFPFMMPCLIAAVICFMACAAVFFYLPETNQSVLKTVYKEAEEEAVVPLNKSPPPSEIFVDVEGSNIIQSDSNLARMINADEDLHKEHSSSNCNTIYRPNNLSKTASPSTADTRRHDESTNDFPKEQTEGEESKGHGQGDTGEESEQEVVEKKPKTLCERFCNNIFFQLLRSSKVIVVIGLYSLTSFSIIGFEEVFILFASTEIYLGGLSFSTNDLGAATGLMSIPLLTLQLFFFPRMERRFGAKITSLICSAALMMLIMVSPLTRLLVDQPVSLWIALFFILAPLRIMTTSTFTAISLMVNNSVKPCHAGTVNGLTVLFAAVARAIAPLFGGSGFAWSITNGLPYPLDVSFTFVVFSLAILASACINIFAPVSLNKQNKGENKGVENKLDKPNTDENGGCEDTLLKKKNDGKDATKPRTDENNGCEDMLLKDTAREKSLV